jgi:hypothetical protein
MKKPAMLAVIAMILLAATCVAAEDSGIGLAASAQFGQIGR